MKVEVLYSKIHRAMVTNAELDYEGSISIDKELIKKAKLFVNQRVDIYNCSNGARFSTYVIEGKSQEICLNGAAARHVQKGDRVIIVAYASIDIQKIEEHKPTLVFVDDKNRAKEIRKSKKPEKRATKSKY